MRKPPNKLWAFGPPISLLLLAFAYYVKVAAFRNAVDKRFPWVKEHLAQFVPEPTVVMIRDPANSAELDRPPQPNPNGSLPAGSSGGAAKNKAKASSVPATPPPELPLTMERFVANPSLWPKKVKLRKTTEFPAVSSSGKRVGVVQAPPGTEAHLIKIQNQLLGVEYQGGGAWVPISETDLLDQVKIVNR
jgi:hypothetical protein